MRRQWDHLLYGEMLAQHSFNLAQFNTKTAYLHLLVLPSYKLDAAVYPVPYQIPGAVESCSRLR